MEFYEIFNRSSGRSDSKICSDHRSRRYCSRDRKAFIAVLFLSAFFATQAWCAVKVAVVGAGLSGLTAAYRLQKAGLDVDVYEARNREGGRVFTVQVNQTFEELGGRDLNDGGDAAHIIRLVKEMGIKIDSYHVKTWTYFYDKKTNRVYDLYRDLLPGFPPVSSSTVQELKKLENESKNLGEVPGVRGKNCANVG